MGWLRPQAERLPIDWLADPTQVLLGLPTIRKAKPCGFISELNWVMIAALPMKFWRLLPLAVSTAALLPMIVSSGAPSGFVQVMKAGLPESPTCRV